MTRIADWRDVGIFPLQDHEADVPLGKRMQIVGARITKALDPGTSSDPADVDVELGRDKGLGMLGDIHPWLYWQTADRGRRATGSWAQAFAAIVTNATTGGGTTTGQESVMLPIRNLHWQSDKRYYAMVPASPRGLSRVARGQLMVVMAATEEHSQQQLALVADNRLIAVNTEGPGDCGTLVCDMQPRLNLCMDGSQVPGVGGRHARLQSMMRVIPLDHGSSPLMDFPGNGVAWNLTRAGVDSLAGYGMVFCDAVGTAPGRRPSGPTTPGSGTGTAPTTPGSGFAAVLNPGSENLGFDDFATDTEGDYLGKAPEEFGVFRAVDSPHVVSFMAYLGTGGPFCGGSTSDKHFIGLDRDGHAMTSGHLDIHAQWFEDSDRDGPMMFEGDYPHPGPLPLLSRVHLSWDANIKHPWMGSERDGMWRWWCEVPYVAPRGGGRIPQVVVPPGGGPGGPGGPGSPGGPSGPGGPGGPGPPGGPTTGGPGGPTAPNPSGPSTGGPPGPTGPPGPPGPKKRGLTTPGGSSGWIPGTPWAPGYGPGGQFPPSPSTPGSGPGGGPTAPEPSGKNIGEPSIGPPELVPPAPKPTTTPRDPVSPTAPDEPSWTIPSLRGETTGAPGIVTHVGMVAPGDVGLYAIHHPMMESFASVSLRPQLWARGLPNFEHGGVELGADLMMSEEQITPHVVTMRAWGAQDSSTNDWKYTALPQFSRSRGGAANGGVLWSPPGFEMEDYFTIGNYLDVRAPATTSYVTAAPGVSFALGTPNLDGGLNIGSVAIAQDLTNNDALKITQLDPSRTVTTLITAKVFDNGGGTYEVDVAIGGSQALVIPSGTTAERPATPRAGMLRINTDGGTDRLEYWDSGGAAWRQVPL